MEGPTQYWNQKAKAIAIVSSKTERLRPDVPDAVVPKHELHRLLTVEHAQYVKAKEIVDPIASIKEIEYSLTDFLVLLYLDVANFE